MSAALVAIGALAALVFAAGFCWRPDSVLKSVVKTVSVAALCAASLGAGGPVWLTLALGLGAAGDFFLSRRGQRAFLAGLIAFAVAHIVYVVLMVQAGAGGWQFGVGVGLLIGFIGVMILVLYPRAGAMRGPVMGYIAIIAAMGLTALHLPEVLWLAQLAALLFIASDTLLSLDLFVWRPPYRGQVTVAIVLWAFYWTAQALFLLAFAPGVFA